MPHRFPIHRFKSHPTPFYYYDMELLHHTLEVLKEESGRHPHFAVHYAIKANANPDILDAICKAGLGADCVSGGEIQKAIDAGFHPSKIVFAGVGKSDWEINIALRHDIFCFNAESIEELRIIDQLAAESGRKARISLRINPNVGAHTHHNIVTGLAENKFGIPLQTMDAVIEEVRTKLSHLNLVGLHFHIGSQILDMSDFEALCNRINELQARLMRNKICLDHINVGGGLGINYESPDAAPLADFRSYFDTFARHLKLQPHQTVHFELGRSVVGSCGSLITKILYVKQGLAKQFAIVDAGMTELIRPALYNAYHKIENLTSSDPTEAYDVVGPICESSDVFAKAVDLPRCHRGDIVAIRCAGAYGESMASQYNCRPLPASYLSTNI